MLGLYQALDEMIIYSFVIVSEVVAIREIKPYPTQNILIDIDFGLLFCLCSC